MNGLFCQPCSNCTLLELKVNEIRPAWFVGESSNCTLLELKDSWTCSNGFVVIVLIVPYWN